MQDSNYRPSILMGSKNPMKRNDSNQSISQIKNNNLKNVQKIKNRLFILSPAVKEGKDIECTGNDFSQEKNDYINLGYIGKAIKVLHKKTNRLYSIKAIKKDKIIKNKFLNSFNKLLEIMYKVDHCFFLRLLNHFEDDVNLYLIFQCIKDVSLLDKINLRALTKDQIYKYFKQILEALQFLHSKKINSISLEPESILIDNDDNVRLTDYSYSKINNSESNARSGFKTDTNMFINSYTAPELISYNKGKLHKHRSKGSEKSDLWQLGMLIYEMITGNLLFDKNLGVDEFYKLITTPVIKNNDIIKKISEIPDDFKSFTDVILQLLYFEPNERISIENILKIREIQKINYIKEEIEYSERIINLKNANEDISPQEQLINKLKKENKILKNEVNELKIKVNELTTKNEDLNKQNINYNKIINEEPNEENIKKFVEFKSQLRTLQSYNDIAQSSLKEEKSINEALNKKVRELQMNLEEKNFESSTKIKSLEKKIEDLENKLFNPSNSGYSNESLQYYLTLFNDNINQFISLINHQIKINNDLSENNLSKLQNFLIEKEKVFNNLINDIILKMSQNLITRYSENLGNNNINEKKYKDKIIWLESQIEELIPFKQKCLRLQEQIDKLQNENEFFKNKNENCMKFCKEKEELNYIKIQKFKDKIKECFDKYIMQNCPNKYDEFKIIFQNFCMEN